jgi:hypothetical protein
MVYEWRIYLRRGQKNANGHSSGLFGTYDQYDGDQVMQLLTEDYMEGDKRFCKRWLSVQRQTIKVAEQNSIAYEGTE